MIVKKYGLVSFGVLLLSGCMSTPSSTEISNAYYGILPQYYEGQITQTIGAGLKDPDSAKFGYQDYMFMYINHNLTDVTLKFKTGYAKTI